MRFAQRVAMVCLALAGWVSATTYYVSPDGANGNSGTDSATPWRTLLKVGISTFQPGDTILFKRDGVWNEWLTPPSSGTAGNLIKFDAYGTGKPPEFTGQLPTTADQWTNSSGNVWQITLSAEQAISQLKFVQFGTIWGNSQLTLGAVTHNRDWFYNSSTQVLSVYSSSGNPVTAYGAVAPIILSGQSLINLNGVSYVEIQHIKLDWYDGYGVQVQGASDHIWLANILADSQVPNATVPIGFFVHPSGTPGDIHLLNTDSHRNYVGYRFDGTATAIELKNCRAFVNRTFGLMDDVTQAGWSGQYEAWSDFLPGAAADIFPGDGVNVDAASRGANFDAVVREVEIAVKDLAGEHSEYKIGFADDAAAPLGFEFDTAQVSSALDLAATPKDQVGSTFLAPLTGASITEVTSTTATVDAGAAAPVGGGIEVRWSDAGWGPANDRNLAFRATTQTFNLPRLSRVQNYFLRQFDGSTPPKYSRYSAALHLDYPL